MYLILFAIPCFVWTPGIYLQLWNQRQGRQNWYIPLLLFLSNISWRDFLLRECDKSEIVHNGMLKLISVWLMIITQSLHDMYSFESMHTTCIRLFIFYHDLMMMMPWQLFLMDILFCKIRQVLQLCEHDCNSQVQKSPYITIVQCILPWFIIKLVFEIMIAFVTDLGNGIFFVMCDVLLFCVVLAWFFL